MVIHYFTRLKCVNNKSNFGFSRLFIENIRMENIFTKQSIVDYVRNNIRDTLTNKNDKKIRAYKITDNQFIRLVAASYNRSVSISLASIYL